MVSTYISYQTIANNLSRFQTATANTGTVKNETAYYQANIGKIKTVSDLVNNPRLFNYVMTAFGLGSQTYAKGLVTKLLTQGTSGSTALANTLNDPRYLALAKTFDFVTFGTNTGNTRAVQDKVVKQYIEQSLEKNQAQSNQGVQLALYFSHQASTIKNVYNILADKSLLTVVQTAVGISATTASQDIDTQANNITLALQQNGMTMADFQDSTKVANFIQRFTAQYDASQYKNSASNNALALFSNNTKKSNTFGDPVITNIANILASANGVSNAGTASATSPTVLFTSASSQNNGISSSLLQTLANLQLGGG